MVMTHAIKTKQISRQVRLGTAASRTHTPPHTVTRSTQPNPCLFLHSHFFFPSWNHCSLHFFRYKNISWEGVNQIHPNFFPWPTMMPMSSTHSEVHEKGSEIKEEHEALFGAHKSRQIFITANSHWLDDNAVLLYVIYSISPYLASIMRLLPSSLILLARR